ncbi:MAG: indolepyruvate oxidoreductase subunit beta [Desulfovibrio sp.]|jgi:indolepyruvate ferredoxin oxidoreductase beta subunit|nr:indolepyruvate oxidoreductase subunit beta [Desulfovibrio sp.]
MSAALRIFLTGVGGQGSLTATTLLARTVMDQGFDVVSGEIHGMAQRGGVVESTVLLGGFRSPAIGRGEADILLGFEALESLRALPYLAPGAFVLSSSEFIPPPGVSMGKDKAPALEEIKETLGAVAGKAWFLPINALGRKAGAVQSANSVLLGALCATGLLPFGPEALRASVKKYLPAKSVEANLRALELGEEEIRISAGKSAKQPQR